MSIEGYGLKFEIGRNSKYITEFVLVSYLIVINFPETFWVGV